MKKYFPLFWVFYLLCAFSAHAGEGRYTIPLTGGGWSLWLDKEASWQNDCLYLPHEITDLSLLPVNLPTGGWQTLSHNPDAVPVEVPGTVEEYLTVTDNPRPENFRGVSWWYRKITIPADQQKKRFIIYFESVRMRAEVYLDGKLVAYDLIGHQSRRQFPLAGFRHNEMGRIQYSSFEKLHRNYRQSQAGECESGFYF